MQSMNAETLNLKIYNIGELIDNRHKIIKNITRDNDDKLYHMAIVKLGKNIMNVDFNYDLEYLIDFDKTIDKNTRDILSEYNANLIDTYKNNSYVIFGLIKSGLILPKKFFYNHNLKTDALLQFINNPANIDMMIKNRHEFSRLVEHLPNYMEHMGNILVYWGNIKQNIRN